MDEEATDLIRRLCTRIGAIMEDESPRALLWVNRDQLSTLEHLKRLDEAGKEISTLAAAAKVLMRG
jgi:DNA polymerase III delta subunit